MKKLNDNELKKVSGGFTEDDDRMKGYTFGMNISCPRCHRSDRSDFDANVFIDSDLKTAEYRCKCGARIICFRGHIILEEDWLAALRNGTLYRFQ